MATPDLDTVRAEYEAFPDAFESLLMATCDGAGEPTASYAPYLRDGIDFYVYVSELAAHTRNLREQGKVSVLFVEDEAKAKIVFARKRVTFNCTAQEVPRDAPAFDAMLDRFSAKFGALVQTTLRELKDFHLYRLRPHKASYVSGFALAFVIEGDDLNQLRHRNDEGHRTQRDEVRERMDRLQEQTA